MSSAEPRKNKVTGFTIYYREYRQSRGVSMGECLHASREQYSRLSEFEKECYDIKARKENAEMIKRTADVRKTTLGDNLAEQERVRRNEMTWATTSTLKVIEMCKMQNLHAREFIAVLIHGAGYAPVANVRARAFSFSEVSLVRFSLAAGIIKTLTIHPPIPPVEQGYTCEFIEWVEKEIGYRPQKPKSNDEYVKEWQKIRQFFGTKQVIDEPLFVEGQYFDKVRRGLQSMCSAAGVTCPWVGEDPDWTPGCNLFNLDDLATGMRLIKNHPNMTIEEIHSGVSLTRRELSKSPMWLAADDICEKHISVEAPSTLCAQNLLRKYVKGLLFFVLPVYQEEVPNGLRLNIDQETLTELMKKKIMEQQHRETASSVVAAHDDDWGEEPPEWSCEKAVAVGDAGGAWVPRDSVEEAMASAQGVHTRFNTNNVFTSLPGDVNGGAATATSDVKARGLGRGRGRSRANAGEDTTAPGDVLLLEQQQQSQPRRRRLLPKNV